MSKSTTPCWNCRSDLVVVDGKLSYKVFVDPIGNKHMVHASCLNECEAEGKQNRVVQPVGAPDPLLGGTYHRTTGIPLEEYHEDC